MNRSLSIIFISVVVLTLTSLASCRAHRSVSTTEVAATGSRIETHTTLRDTSYSATRQSISSTSRAIADSVTIIRGNDSTVIIHVYRPRTSSVSNTSSGQASASVTTHIDSTTIAAAATVSRNSAVESEGETRAPLPLWCWLAIALVTVALVRWLTMHA